MDGWKDRNIERQTYTVPKTSRDKAENEIHIYRNTEEKVWTKKETDRKKQKNREIERKIYIEKERMNFEKDARTCKHLKALHNSSERPKLE